MKQIIETKIININKTFLEVITQDKKSSTIHLLEILVYFVLNISKMFEIEKKYWFLILKNKNNNLKLNWKKLNPRFFKNPFKFKILETRASFKDLEKNTKTKLLLETQND